MIDWFRMILRTIKRMIAMTLGWLGWLGELGWFWDNCDYWFIIGMLGTILESIGQYWNILGGLSWH